MATVHYVAVLAAAVILVLSPVSAQPVVDVEFSELDFQAVEGEGVIDATLSVDGTTPIDLVLLITPFTFEEYTVQLGRALHPAIAMRSVGIDRAEFDSAEGGKKDFPKDVTMVTIPAGAGISQDFPVSIPINLDNINEAAEGFLILVETSQQTSVMAEAPIINYARDGLAIGLIADDDEITFMFERPTYTVNESAGDVPDLIQVVRDIPTELEYTFNISLRTGDFPTTEGADFVFMDDLIVFFLSDVESVPVPISILRDDVVEMDEDFRLALLSQADNPTTNIRLAGNIDTQVVIKNENVLKISFVDNEEMPLVFNERDGTVMVCAAYDRAQLETASALIIFSIFTEPITATNPDDYIGLTRTEALANPTANGLTPVYNISCVRIEIVDDQVDGEGSEQFQLDIVFADFLTNVLVESCPANVTILDRPVNECTENLDNCDPIAECVDLLDGFRCICPEDFTGDGTICEGINECELGLDNCSPNARCTKTIGSFECICVPGFTGDGVTCVDINECELGLDNCSPNAICINTIGSFDCICLPGFAGDGITCDDIDECALRLVNCSPDARCTNTVGSYVCVCLPSFICEDINECELGLDNCSPNARCINVILGFECMCLTGFTAAGDGVTCDDINECELGIDNCSPNERCTNTIGSFECMCLPGFTGDGITCGDINDCELGHDNCSPNARCINTIGTFECTCLPGFTGDGVTCVDINECELGLDNCFPNARCTNTIGSFECMCLPGLTGDGVTCGDINECELGIDNCSPNALCINTIGTFECTCLLGFTGDSVTCVDINECELGIDNCCPNALCINTIGSFDCITCPPGFTSTGDTCVDINECELGIGNCSPNARCTNTIGNFECRCLPGFTGDGVTCDATMPSIASSAAAPSTSVLQQTPFPSIDDDSAIHTIPPPPNTLPTSNIPQPTSDQDQFSSGTSGTVIIATVTVCFLLLTGTIVLILALLWVRRRKHKLETVDNVAYNCHESEINTTKNAAYGAVNSIVTATNAATSVPSTSADNDVDIAICSNAAYTPTSIATSVNVAYEPVKDNTVEYDYINPCHLK